MLAHKLGIISKLGLGLIEHKNKAITQFIKQRPSITLNRSRERWPSALKVLWRKESGSS